MFRKAHEELYMTQYEEMQHRKIAMLPWYKVNLYKRVSGEIVKNVC